MEPLLEGSISDQATGLIIGTRFGTVVRSLHASVIAGFPGICVFRMVETINNRQNDHRRSTSVFLAAQLQGIKRDLL
jgi:large-conductance mechanosensitive channel